MGKTDRLLDDYKKSNSGGFVADIYKEMSKQIVSDISGKLKEEASAKALPKDLEERFCAFAWQKEV